MTAANHVLAGALVATVISMPIIAIPVAFVSHFVLDAVPHFGYKEGGYENALKRKMTYFVLTADIIALALVARMLADSSLTVIVASLAAVSPDAYNIFQHFIVDKRRSRTKEEWNGFSRLHKNIQRFERPWGILVEVVFFSVCFYLARELL